jgi:hypothetical protein
VQGSRLLRRCRLAFPGGGGGIMVLECQRHVFMCTVQRVPISKAVDAALWQLRVCWHGISSSLQMHAACAFGAAGRTAFGRCWSPGWSARWRSLERLQLAKADNPSQLSLAPPPLLRRRGPLRLHAPSSRTLPLRSEGSCVRYCSRRVRCTTTFRWWALFPAFGACHCCFLHAKRKR